MKIYQAKYERNFIKYHGKRKDQYTPITLKKGKYIQKSRQKNKMLLSGNSMSCMEVQTTSSVENASKLWKYIYFESFHFL